MTLLNLSSPNKVKLALNIIVLFISLYGASKKDLTEEEVTTFQRIVIEATAPMQSFIINLRKSINYFFDHYVLLVSTTFENDQLKKRVHELENSIFILKELELENRRLKDLLKFGAEITREKILAQVVGLDSTSEFKVLRINKGTKDGIKLKSTVVTTNGLVGHVYRLSDHYSDVLTILDQNSRIDSIVTRTRSHGIVRGSSDFKCVMKYVTRTEPIQNGDEIVTAGLGNIYPKGLKVGTIVNIERESYGISQLVELVPSIDFRKLEEVIVLIQQEQNNNNNIIATTPEAVKTTVINTIQN
ncbi:MAG: rod shape-determining protein MreC [Oligoflexia bacterium]|nr:rod shape-determining protein MreC [Oligoflexia bacterium]